ncbi:hypothetical protein [Bacillus sp. Bva_UNVM-123]|uniref:hypothetical protein n=1 Tax=Bacillus sp. Bva_UNVM-123 TaxID=2829798 RepID=UPI00391F8F0B
MQFYTPFMFVAAGILGDAFGKLFKVIWDGIKWIGNLFKNLLQGLVDIFIGFFKIIYALIDGILYFSIKSEY